MGMHLLGLGGLGHQLWQGAGQRLANLGGVGANRALHGHLTGHDIAGRAAMDAAHGDHAHALRQVGPAADQGLHAVDHIGARHDRIGTGPGHRAVGLLAFELDAKTIGAIERRAHLVLNLSRVRIAHHMHAKDRLDSKLLDHTLLHHAPGTPARSLGIEHVDIGRAFFRRLEDEDHLARHLVLVLRHHARRTQQHGGVRIVAASVHDVHDLAEVVTLRLTCKRQARGFLHRQRIHVGTQPHGGARQAALQHGHHTGAGNAGMDLQTQLLQVIRHIGRRLVLEIAKLGMLMDVTTPVDDLRLDRRGRLCHPGRRAEICGHGHEAAAGQCSGECNTVQESEGWVHVYYLFIY